MTGAALRIGAAIALYIACGQANVVVHHRTSSAAAEALVRELSGVRAGSAQTLKADLLDVRALPAFAAVAVAAFGQLDMLVNNASTFYPTPGSTVSILSNSTACIAMILSSVVNVTFPSGSAASMPLVKGGRTPAKKSEL